MEIIDYAIVDKSNGNIVEYYNTRAEATGPCKELNEAAREQGWGENCYTVIPKISNIALNLNNK
jgi:hypothetical protein